MPRSCTNLRTNSESLTIWACVRNHKQEHKHDYGGDKGGESSGDGDGDYITICATADRNRWEQGLGQGLRTYAYACDYSKWRPQRTRDKD